jgi:hypothetical protein
MRNTLCMLGYFFKNQSGKIRNMNGKRSSSFPTDVCRIAPNLIPWSLRKNKTVLFKFKSLPYFAFTFLTRLTHDYLAATRKADAIYLKFFEDISRDATLNKTVLFFLSDHGIRFGAIRQTSVGKLEERLPFMFLIFPDCFFFIYPSIHRILQVNSNISHLLFL